MTIGHAGKKISVPAAQLLLEKNDQLGGLLAGNMPGRMVFDPSLLDRQQIAAHGHLAVLDPHAHAGRFERTAPLEHFRQIVSQNRKVGDLAAGSEPGRNRGEHSAPPQRRDPVDRRLAGGLKRRSPPKEPIGSSAMPSPRIMMYFICNSFIVFSKASPPTMPRASYRPRPRSHRTRKTPVPQRRPPPSSLFPAVGIEESSGRNHAAGVGTYRILAMLMMSANTPAAVTLAPAP